MMYVIWTALTFAAIQVGISVKHNLFHKASLDFNFKRDTMVQ